MEEEQQVKAGASPDGDRATGLRPQPAAQSSQSSVPSADAIVYEQMIREQGVWANGCSVETCGPTTGHFVRPLAFCDRPETATALARAFTDRQPSAPVEFELRLASLFMAFETMPFSNKGGQLITWKREAESNVRQLCRAASAMSARSDETRSGSTEGESPAPEGGDAQTPSGQDQ